MKRTQTKVRSVRGRDANFSAEARAMQRQAIEGVSSVVRLGPIVFFSTATGDAWMLDPEDGLAACLARDFESRRIPILETDETFSIEWSASYAIEDGLFVVAEADRSSRAIAGYPTVEILGLIPARAGGSAVYDEESVAAAERLKTGRNDLCPCGSGRKYKRCCLSKDQALVRQAGATTANVRALPPHVRRRNR